MKKRIIAIVLSALMVAGVSTGCGKSNSSSATADTKAPLTWMFWDDMNTSKDSMTAVYKSTVDRFNKSSGYKVKIVSTDLDSYDSKLNALVAANNMPDIIICNPGPNMTQYYNAGDLYNLSDVFKKETSWKDTFTNGIFKKLTYDGNIYGVPTCYASACCFYNKDIFSKAGVQIPTTMDQFYAACDKIKNAGFTPITVSAKTSWCLSVIATYCFNRQGVHPADLNSGKIKFTDPKCVAAVNMLMKMSKYFQSSCLSDSNDQATANFYNGKAAMLIQGSWAIGQINGSNQSMLSKTGVFSFPSATSDAEASATAICKTDNLCISKNTKNLPGCIAFLKAMTDKTTQAEVAEKGGKSPVINMDINYKVAPAELKDVIAVTGKAKRIEDFYDESLATVEAGTKFDDTMVAMVMHKKTVDEGLKSYQDYYKQFLK